MSLLPVTAAADESGPVRTGADSFVLKYRAKHAAKKSHPRVKSSSSNTPTPAQRQADYRKAVEAAIAANARTQEAAENCLASATQSNCAFGELKVPPDALGGGTAIAHFTEPVLSPQQAAYVASARLRLTAPKPMVGPSPDINKWKMAAVGYPLWLWADGNLDPAPVTDSVYDISVGLDARLVKVVFDMGDGHKVSCTDVSRGWTSAVAAGAESPSCGYWYPKPSLPKGSYTVTANAVWTIDWNVNGTTGTIPFYQSASTKVPVGELQVLVR